MANMPRKPELQVVELQLDRSRRPRAAYNEGILWVVAAGLMLIIGILKGINLVIVLGYLLLGLWVVNWILARRAVRGLSARRLPRPPLEAGIPSEWTLEIHDDGTGTGTWTLEERAGEARAAWLVVRDRGRTAFRPRVRGMYPRHGRYRLQPLVARSSFPFGLARKSRVLLPATEVIVLPKPARVDGERMRNWLFHAFQGRDEERRKIRRIVEREAEIHGLRDYRSGDSPRRVHWKVTARRNKLTVREYEDTAPPRLLLVVDPWLPPKPDRHDKDRLEAVLSLAVGIVREWRRGAGARLALVLAGPKPTALDGPPGPATTERQLIALALENGGVAGDVAGALGELSRTALAAPALVVSSRGESPVVAAVQRVLGRSVAFTHVGRRENWCQLK
jgi:uncharacterized protein (DUF58 family)